MKVDWKLIYKAYCSIEWLMASNDGNNADKTLRTLYGERIAPTWGNERLLNEGFLMMASYISLVYVLEKENRKKVDLSLVNISDFKITLDKKKIPGNKEFLRRLRNSISHGKYRFDNNRILFHDYNPHDRTCTEIRFQIDKVKFGMFLTNFVKEIDRQVNF